MRYSTLLLALLIPVSAAAQHHASHEAAPATLVSGLGDVNHPVSTTNIEAQRFFNQGLAYIYAFNHDEAFRSFQRAAQLDPKLAMAYWGMALSLGSNYNLQADEEQLKKAHANLQKSLALANDASEHERGYIQALSKRYSLDVRADRRQLATDYKTAMADLVARYPDDLDAATLYAESMMNLRPWKLWSRDGKPAEGTLEIVATLERVLRRDPTHTGANHYYIHAIEASPNPELGLPSAARLGGLAPSAGHLVHMPSHIYIRTGDYHDAAKSNVDAIVADRAYIARSGVQGVYPMMYYNHNIHFLAASHAMNGRFADALKTARELEANVTPHLKSMPMLEMFAPYATVTLVRFGRWDDILKAPEPDPSLKITAAFWRFARGMAYTASAQVAPAEAELKALRETVQGIPETATLGNSNARAVLQVADLLLSGRIALALGEKQTGFEILHKAVLAEEGVNYNEPPDWDLPVREWLGGALLVAGDYGEAERVYRVELSKHPRNGRALFGLVEGLKRQRKNSSAQMVQREFERAWEKADTQLSIEALYATTERSSAAAVKGAGRSTANALRFDDIHLATGIRMRFAEQGNPAGHPIVFLHGYTDSWFSFSRILPSFADGYHAYALDLRGHGDSDRPDSGYHPRDFVADVLAFIDAKKLTGITLVGHSMGSFIAQQVALAAGTRVSRLVLIGSGATPRTEATKSFEIEVRGLKDPINEKFVRDFQVSTVHHPVPGDFLDRIVQESLKLTATVWRDVLEGLVAQSNEVVQLSGIKAPTLVVWGDRDTYFPRAEQDLLTGLLPDPILKVYRDTGHCPHWERPEQFVSDLKTFISQTERSR